MANCTYKKRKHRKVCIGDMDTLILLQNRAIVGPTDGGVDFTEDFSDTGEVWALVETVTGLTVFDGTNTEVVVTHQFYVNYDPTIEANSSWIELDGEKYNILTVEDLDERHEILLLNANLRGTTTKQVNFA